jgi:ParB-like chromosome segregation protein Spo0J
MPTLRIACTGAGSLPFKTLKNFQGGLKSLTRANYRKLRAQLEDGFSFPVAVWQAPDGKTYIIDGHQRLRVVKRMAREGWTIPDLPVVFVEAGTVEEARRKLVAGASQYGEIDEESLYEFIEEFEIDLDYVMELARFPEVDLDEFKTNYYLDEPPEEDKEKKSKTCPHCGLEI